MGRLVGAWCLFFLFVLGCGDGAGPVCPAADGHCTTAHFSFSDGRSFWFAGVAAESSVGDQRTITATDAMEPYTIAIYWNQPKIEYDRRLTGTGVYTPNAVGGPVQLLVTRPHPTDPNRTRTSNTRHGTLTVLSIGKESGDVVSGTFEGIRLIRDKPDDKIDLTLTQGVFSVEVD